jgi:hypothetical protein
LGAGLASIASIRGGQARGLGTLGVVALVTMLLDINAVAGAGFQLALGSNLGLNGGATMIRNAEGKYDAQYTLGLSARFGKL